MSIHIHATDVSVAFDVQLATADGRFARKVKFPASSMQILHQYVDTAQDLMEHKGAVEVVIFSLPVNFEYSILLGSEGADDSILLGSEGADDYHLAQLDRFHELVARFKPIGVLASRRPGKEDEDAYVALYLVFWDTATGTKMSTLDLIKSRFSF